ncbi:hypothetical protein SUDANB176_07849 (plasmid) [Streptomyces sp. enrichment culture]
MAIATGSAAITAQDRPQGRIKPVHAMNEATNPEGHKRSLPGRPPGIRADNSELTDQQRHVIRPSMREIGQAGAGARIRSRGALCRAGRS